MALLPDLETRADYFAVFGDDAIWRPAIRVIAERHGLGGAELNRASSGSHVVFLGDAVVVKLFAPPWPEDFDAERRMLAHVGGRLPIATPDLLAQGEIEGWPYLVLGRLEGRDLGQLWPTLSVARQLGLLEQIGELAAALHDLPLPVGTEDAMAAWSEFIATRKARLGDKHRADGVPPAWVEAIERHVASLPALERWAGDVACLHTDLHPGNLVVVERGDRLELSGLFDFADAMLGAREHELIATAAFMAPAVPGGLRALLRGYGVVEPERDPDLAMRLTGHLLLQRYCALPSVVARLASPPDDLSQLFERLWSLRG